MKQALATCPQVGNKLWTAVYPSMVAISAWFAGWRRAPRRCSSRREDTLDAAHHGPLRGGTWEAVGHDRRCPSQADREHAVCRDLRGAGRRRLCGESRSGPGPGNGGCASSAPPHAPEAAQADLSVRVEARLAWPRKEAHATWRDRRGSEGARAPARPGHREVTARRRAPGLQAITGLCSRIAEVGRYRRRRAARHRESEAAPGTPAVEGVLDWRGSPPLTRRRQASVRAGLRGGDAGGQTLAPRGEDARQRASAARIMTSLLADNARRKERCAESAVRGSTGPRRAWVPG